MGLGLGLAQRRALCLGETSAWRDFLGDEWLYHVWIQDGWRWKHEPANKDWSDCCENWLIWPAIPVAWRRVSIHHLHVVST